MKKLLLLLLIIFLLLPALLIASGGEKEAPKKEAKKTTLIIGISNTPSGIDIDIEGDPQTFEIIDAVYDGGTERQYIEMRLKDGSTILYEDPAEKGQPWLFESYVLDEATRTITVGLRKGVKSARGNEFTTKDMEWTYQRNASLKAIGRFALILTGVDLNDNLGGFKIIDDYTYQLTQTATSYPIDRFDLMNSNLWCAPWDSTETKKHVTNDDPWASDYIGVNGGGFGPYHVKEWKAGEQIILEANPYYWDGPPKQFTTIIYKVIPENANRIAALKEGTIDIAAGLTPREISELVDAPGLRVINASGPAFLMLWMNREHLDAFKDPKVIQAINCAIPREDIAELAFHGFAKPMTSVVPKMVGNGVSKRWPFEYNIEKAKRILSGSKYPKGFNVTMHYDAAYPHYETTCLLLKESLEKIGIDVTLQKAPSGVYDSQLRNRELTMLVYPTTTWSAEPTMPLLQWYGVDHYENYGNWYHPDFDRLVYETSLISDPGEKAKAIDRLGEIMLETPPVGYVVEMDDLIVTRKELTGWSWLFEHNVKLNWLYWED
jgi:peptide/nickel transport system substrate-binding protein